MRSTFAVNNFGSDSGAVGRTVTLDGRAHEIIGVMAPELDLPQKLKRLSQWCVDATAASAVVSGPRYAFIFVDQASFEKHKPTSFAGLMTAFTEYRS